MNPYVESTIARYRALRVRGETGQALAVADNICTLVEMVEASLADFAALQSIEAELSGGFFRDDPEAKSSALNRFTQLALRIMARPSTDEKWLREVAKLTAGVWATEGGLRWVP